MLKLPCAVRVVDFNDKPLYVTLTADGILFRRPRKRDSYLLPYAAGETRAQTLAAGIGQATGRASRRATRGLLKLERQSASE